MAGYGKVEILEFGPEQPFQVCITVTVWFASSTERTTLVCPNWPPLAPKALTPADTLKIDIALGVAVGAGKPFSLARLAAISFPSP